MSEFSQNILRFAPTPNGYLHLGHAYSALLNWQIAQDFGGQFLLRIENIDLIRSKPEFETAIYDDLKWLGLEWPEPVMRQSNRFACYDKALKQLISDGLVYPAFLSRQQIRQKTIQFEMSGKTWPRDPDGAPLYPDSCRKLSHAERDERINQGEAFNWRLDMFAALKRLDQTLTWTECDQQLNEHLVAPDPALWGDVVIARRGFPTSYHLSVVVDDAAQNINLIVRGTDLYPATSLHRLLQILLELPEPRYCHHRLILSHDRQKLSKRNKDQSIKELREKQGLHLEEIKQLII